MTQTAADLDVFERTLHKTNIWLKDVMRALPTDERRDAYVALRAALHALRDRLTVDETAQFGAQLPMLIRGFYYEGWEPAGKPLKIRDTEEFLALLAQELTGDIDPERAARAVFTVLAERVADGEIDDVKHMLPAEIRDLWP